MKERKYNVIATITDGEEVKHINKKVIFTTDLDDYGNGTYMWWGEEDYDLRYDTGYDRTKEISYLVGYMADKWSRTWKLIGVQVTEANE